MTVFVMGTRLSPESAATPSAIDDVERRVMEHVHSACPRVRWLHSWAVLGAFDYIDVFEAPDVDTAMKLSAIFRSYGRVDTAIWPATEWSRFKALMETLPER